MPIRLTSCFLLSGMLLASGGLPARAAELEAEVKQRVDGGLAWLASQQSDLGHWTANDGRYPTAMTAMAGMAFLCEGSTIRQGKYAENVRKAVYYLLSKSRQNGLIGDPDKDDRYTYGHGFSMLFLSQIVGEEDDEQLRQRLIDVLERGIVFSGRAQTSAGGWGYLSAREGHNYDEGSTTITQVQALRGCRNAGLPVSKKIIDDAVGYIKDCTMDDGAVQYSSKGGGPRPAITAAAIACLFNAGEYDTQYVPKLMKYCEQNLDTISSQSFGHWHYAHYYYSQVKYREGGEVWSRYRDRIYQRIVNDSREVKSSSGIDMYYWPQGYIGPVYTTAVNLTILQLDKAMLPIYQR